MLICSCAVISDHDIELALLEIMIEPEPPLPTPGVVWRHLSKKMNCCGCAPLAVETIYRKLDELEAKGLICPSTCASAKVRMRRPQSQQPREARADRTKAAEPSRVGTLAPLAYD